MGDLIQWAGHSLHVSKNIYPCAVCKTDTHVIELDTNKYFCSKKCMLKYIEELSKREIIKNEEG